ncbi:arginine N-succinyltransferase [Sphingomonas koreensis]|jgi:arginine N-succinyltransferase|uniref:Arginine N-succinyltransferase n=1 Tax=Sphingomonas koreensis TaxID=93064 RepID=A0A1L6JD11_9SPHN|nr:arginine N-succinyltransferase [Sphingomonas koreensis]APR53793.1 arginine N-succinyltransferase [Sphingomonas koreensis]MDC7808642.1 arginine N-succinyltransferase [Sphingomonas koreensis]RSU17875.1 arginine N-succinyltransferase [Sphingomonas koreensis]RSU23235.1 arginine N-succinyltransferase [Sphingomonas koreensis]RSU23328.1 arginine N-succinyltransferase [Sphingomonas koreensis]
MTFLIRPAREDDLQALYEMAKLTGGGFTNLPPEKPALRAKLERSALAFSRTDDALKDELFVLVLENSETGEVRGTCQIFTQVGQRWPFYSYRLGIETKHSEALARTFRAEILSLTNDLEGCSEVGGLFLHPGERAGGLGMLLARSRYLFIAMHRARFGDRVLAELRGVIDEAGGSPFWDGVAGRFFGMNFQQADEFNAIHGNQFIADLMPKHPIYTAMLTEGARSVIGLPHPSGRAAMRMLEQEGFAFENYIDIFDGGPTMTARTDQVMTVRDSRTDKVVDIADGGSASIIARGTLSDFRACHGRIGLSDGGVTVDAMSASILGVEAGQEVRHAPR